MLFYRGLKPALGWMLLFGLLGLMRCSLAAQLALHEEVAAFNVQPVELDARERQWIHENPRVTVASVQYPCTCFRMNTGNGAV